MSEANGEITEIKCIGIIGAGQMGSGIAHVLAVAGYNVRLSDISDEQLEQARESIGANLERQIEHEKISSDDKAATLARIATGTGLDLFGDCDLVIESVVENEEVKRDVLKQLCPLIKPDAIICSNTSSISITRLASVTDRPGRFMGMHFMNPVPVMQLVELIRGIALGRRLPGFHGQPDPHADDQRGHLHPLRGRRLGEIHRHGASPRRQPPHGAAAAGRLHRPGHLPGHHARAL
jgi:threonine dehydrogenase-like Zn-dependent dehydrogenase